MITPALPPIDARAAAGFARLDQDAPRWWTPRNFDLNRLDMVSATADVLGQTYGSFDDGLQALELTDYDAWRLGFAVPPDDEDDDHEALGAAWKQLILARRAERFAAQAVA
jgi:hypothetical protein